MSETGALRDAWQEFARTMEDARLAIEDTERFRSSARNRSTIYRSLLQVQAMAYNFAVAPSVVTPRIMVNTTYHTNIYTLGLACQDFFYGATFLDGARRYRLSGRLGEISWISAQVQSGVFGDPGARNLGDFTLSDFAEPDGTFDILLSGGDEDGPHIPLERSAPYNFLWIRRVLDDWSDDPGELRISPVDPVPEFAAPSEAETAARIRSAAGMARFLLNNWAIGLHDAFLARAGGPNTPTYLGGVSDQDVGSPQAYYGAFVYRLADDEALVVEDTVPEAAYWGIQLGDVWSNALDFVNHPTDMSGSRVTLDGDGRFRAVICVQDPRLANWMSTCGNREGIGMIRVFDACARPELPTFTVVKAADLGRVLPTDTTYVSEADRARQLAHRRESLRRLYGE